MNIWWLRIYLLIMIGGLAVTSFAQNPKEANYIWKKRVSRIICLDDEAILPTNKLLNSNDPSLFDILMKAKNEGVIKAYGSCSFTTPPPLAQSVFKYPMFNDDGKESEQSIQADSLNSFYLFDLMEEWSWDNITQGITIKITGIALVKDYWLSCNLHLSRQHLMWFKYRDIAKILKKYETIHPEANLTSAILKCYIGKEHVLKNEEKTNKYKGLLGKTISVIDIAKPDILLPLTNEKGYCNLAVPIFESVEANKIPSYPVTDSMFIHQQDPKKRKFKIKGQLDTLIEENPVTGRKEKRIAFVCFDPCQITDYRIIQFWSFDPNSGVTTIAPTGIQPMVTEKNTNSATKFSYPLFGIKWHDAKRILDQYSQYHPDNNLTLNLWMSYFSEPE